MHFMDKYRPDTREKSEFHNDILDMLKIMSSDESIPHIILYGPDGSGKRTIVEIFLKMLFGKNIKNTRLVPYEIESSGGKKTIEKIKQSNYYIEIEPTGTNYDRYLIHDIVKQYAKSKSLNTIFENNKQFKLVLINNIEDLSSSAQMALRRTMEVYSDKCRFLMVCNCLSKVLKELQSRCVKQRIAAPTDSEIFKYIIKIGIKENINISLEEYSKIIDEADGNIKEALWSLEFKKYGKEKNTELVIAAKKIIAEMMGLEIINIRNIRNLFQNLTITNYSGTQVLRVLLDNIYIMKNISDETKQKIILKGSEIESRLMKKRREIMHIDNFIIYSMKCIYEEK